jgi:PAS domain S-box-containing protein
MAMHDGTPRSLGLSQGTLVSDALAGGTLVSDVLEGGTLVGGEARFRAVFEQAGVGINQVDLATGRYLCVNQRFCDIVGYSEAELSQMTYRDITHPDDIAINTQDMQQLMLGNRASASVEKRYFHKNGSLRWVKLTLSILRDEQGTAIADLGIVEDISTQKQLEAERQAAQAILTEYQQQLEAMVAART